MSVASVINGVRVSCVFFSENCILRIVLNAQPTPLPELLFFSEKLDIQVKKRLFNVLLPVCRFLPEYSSPREDTFGQSFGVPIGSLSVI